MPGNYAILRFGKIKTIADLQRSKAHCARTQETKNADPEKAHLNQLIIGNLENLVPQVETLLTELGQQRKIRPDANLVCEIFASASPAWFRDGSSLDSINPQRVDLFKEKFLEFCQKELGDGCLSAVLHLDETTPHIHAHLIPIHREKGWLSWEDWFGGKEKLRRWQDKFAQYFEPLGLRRGLSRSVAVHEKIQDFYARINEDLQLPDFEQELTLPPPLSGEATENYYQRLVSHFREKLPPLRNALETIAAHAKNEAWEKTQATNTRIMLHAMQDELESLEFQVRQYSQDLQATQLELSAHDTQQQEAIAQEMLAIAQLVLNTAQKNYLRGARYTFSRRRGFTKIDSREGQRRVHDEGGKPTLTENFTPADLIYLRQQRQQLIQKSEAIVLHQEQQAKSGQKKS